jgi:hypothetical protein
MKPSNNLYYQVEDLHFDNMVIFIIKSNEAYLTKDDLTSLRCLNKLHHKMFDDMMRLQFVDFLTLKLPRLDYLEQTDISKERVNLTTACAIHYRLNTGMDICYLNGEYANKSRNADVIVPAVSFYILREDHKHIKQIFDQGCPSYLNFEETHKNKHQALWKGNQQTFLQNPKVTTKAMNKEERNSHVLPFRHWVVFF